MLQKLGLLFVALFCSFVAACVEATASPRKVKSSEDSSELRALKNLPSLVSDAYRCNLIANTVNHLHSLGKDRALNVLHDYDQAADLNTDDNVVIICDLLFKIPRDRRPGLGGQESPALNRAAIDMFPSFPLAEIDGVPFILVHGREFGAWMYPPGKATLEICQDMPLATDYLSETASVVAAQKLIQSEDFLRLYPDPSGRQYMADFIKRQALAK